MIALDQTAGATPGSIEHRLRNGLSLLHCQRRVSSTADDPIGMPLFANTLPLARIASQLILNDDVDARAVAGGAR